MTSSTLKTLFDSFSVSVAKSKSKSDANAPQDLDKVLQQYYNIFDLVMSYTFVTVSPITSLNHYPLETIR